MNKVFQGIPCLKNLDSIGRFMVYLARGVELDDGALDSVNGGVGLGEGNEPCPECGCDLAPRKKQFADGWWWVCPYCKHKYTKVEL